MALTAVNRRNHACLTILGFNLAIVTFQIAPPGSQKLSYSPMFGQDLACFELLFAPADRV